MSNLQRYENDGLELVIDTETGAAYATQAGYVRMAEIPQPTVSKRMSVLDKGDAPNPIKRAEIPTPGGLQGVYLIPAKLVFQWAMKDKPELAAAMGECGATVYLQQLAGYKVTASAPPSPAEVILAQAQQLVNVEREQKRLAEEQARIALEQDELNSKSAEHSRQITQVVAELNQVNAELDRIHNSSDGHYMTIVGFAKVNNLIVDGRTANQLGRRAAKYSRNNNLTIEKVKDTMFGEINAYHPQALSFTFSSYNI